MGFGSKALQFLDRFFKGEIIELNEDSAQKMEDLIAQSEQKEEKKVKPLLKRLAEVRPPMLDYLGVSYGVTTSLFKFWNKCQYKPIYIR